MTTKSDWQQSETACAMELTQLYVNTEKGDEVSEKATQLVVEAWKKAMKQHNPEGVTEVEVRIGKKLDELSVEEMLLIDFKETHPSLPEFAVAVRLAAAVGQKVA